MQRPSAIICLLTMLVAVSAAPAQEARPAGAGESKAETSRTRPSADALGAVLQDALAVVQGDGESERAGGLDLSSFMNRAPAELRAYTLLSIGNGLARVGKPEIARSAWDLVTAAAGGVSGTETRAHILAQMASAQAESGDRDAAKATLQEAARAIRQFKSGYWVPGVTPDPERERVGALLSLGTAQAKVANPAEARKTFAQAVTVADAIKAERQRLAALLEIAEAEQPADAAKTRQHAWQFVTTLEPESRKAMAAETLLRAAIKAGAFDEAIQLVENELTGDTKAFALWAAADGMVASGGKTPPEVVTRLLEIAGKTEFERNSRKTAVIMRIAQAQAVAGDEDGAYRTLGTIEPTNALMRSAFQVGKLHLMMLVARAQLRANDRNGATGTLQVALEMIGPLLREEGSSGGAFVEIVDLLARAGDFRGALETATQIGSSAARVDALVRIGNAQVVSKDYDGAKKTLARALSDVGRIPADELWDRARIRNVVTEAARTAQRPSRGPKTRNDELFSGVSDSMTAVFHTTARIAMVQARAKDVPAALKTAGSIPTEPSGANRERTTVIEAIARLQASRGDFQGALATLDLITEGRDITTYRTKDVVLEDIALEQAKAGDAAGALRWAKAQKAPKNQLSAIRGMADGIVESVAAGQGTTNREP